MTKLTSKLSQVALITNTTDNRHNKKSFRTQKKHSFFTHSPFLVLALLDKTNPQKKRVKPRARSECEMKCTKSC